MNDTHSATASASCSTSASVLAFDFGGSKTAVALFGPDGSIVGEQYLPNSVDGSEPNASSIIETASAVGKSLLGQLDPQSRKNTLVGAVSPGVILHDRILLAPNVADWEAVSLATEMQLRLDGLTVRVANDVKAAAAAEARWGNLAKCDPGLYVNLGTGIAVATIVNGRVIQGAHGWAGEVGYNTAFDNYPETTEIAKSNNAGSGTPNASPEGNGSFPTLESQVGAGALRRLANKHGLGDLDPAALIASIHTLPIADQLVKSAMDLLARHLAPMVHLLDPQRIVLGGGLAGSSIELLPMLQDALHRWLGAEIASEFASSHGVTIELAASAFGRSAALHGARLVALGLFP